MTHDALSFVVNGEVSAADATGQFEATGEFTTAANAANHSGRLHVKLNQLPLDPMHNVATRMGVDISARGSITGEADFSVDRDSRSLAGRLQLDNPSLSSPMLQSDTLASRDVVAIFDLQLANDQLSVRELTVDSDVVNCAVSGNFQLDTEWSSALRLLEQNDYACRGRMDVAQLTQQLRNTFSSRTDANLTEGQLTWDVQSLTKDGQRVISGQLSTHGFQVNRSDKQLVLSQPINARFQVARQADGWIVNDLTGQSTFLSFAGRGDLQQGQFVMRGDLSRLRDELSQFIDLGGADLAGTLDGRFRWQASPDGKLDSEGSFNANGLLVSLASGKTVREPSIDLTYNTTAQLTDRRLSEIVDGRLNVSAGSDQLTAKLTEAIRIDQLHWPIELRLQGDLAQWRQRLQRVLDVRLPVVTGQVDSTVAIHAIDERLLISVPQTEIQELELQLPGNRIREPIVRLNGSASWDRSTAEVAVPDASLACTSVTLRVAELKLNTQGNRLHQGQLSYRGDLGRIWQWVPGRDRSQRPTGSISGSLATNTQNQQTQFRTQTDVNDFRWLQQASKQTTTRQRTDWQELWHEAAYSVGIIRKHHARRGSDPVRAAQCRLGISSSFGERRSSRPARHDRHPTCWSNADQSGQTLRASEAHLGQSTTVQRRGRETI